MYEELMDLKELLDANLISQKEYDMMKNKVLQKYDPSSSLKKKVKPSSEATSSQQNVHYCEHCGTKLVDNVTTCPNCKAILNKQTKTVEDETDGGLILLSFLIPIFGWIYWAVTKDERPNRARECAIAATCSFLLGALIGVVLVISAARNVI